MVIFHSFPFDCFYFSDIAAVTTRKRLINCWKSQFHCHYLVDHSKICQFVRQPCRLVKHVFFFMSLANNNTTQTHARSRNICTMCGRTAYMRRYHRRIVRQMESSLAGCRGNKLHAFQCRKGWALVSNLPESFTRSNRSMVPYGSPLYSW